MEERDRSECSRPAGQSTFFHQLLAPQCVGAALVLPTSHSPLADAAGFFSVVGQEAILWGLCGQEQDLTAFPPPIFHDFPDTSCPRLVPTMQLVYLGVSHSV